MTSAAPIEEACRVFEEKLNELRITTFEKITLLKTVRFTSSRMV